MTKIIETTKGRYKIFDDSLIEDKGLYKIFKISSISGKEIELVAEEFIVDFFCSNEGIKINEKWRQIRRIIKEYERAN